MLLTLGSGSSPSRLRVPAEQKTIDPRVDDMMMRGCPVEPDGLQEAEAFGALALTRQRERRAEAVPLDYARWIGQLAGTFGDPEIGPYDIVVRPYGATNETPGQTR